VFNIISAFRFISIVNLTGLRQAFSHLRCLGRLALRASHPATYTSGGLRGWSASFPVPLTGNEGTRFPVPLPLRPAEPRACALAPRRVNFFNKKNKFPRSQKKFLSAESPGRSRVTRAEREAPTGNEGTRRPARRYASSETRRGRLVLFRYS